ncbi:hypothetical protein [Streptomyces sp. NPDC047028]|uniref:hypothetical protein n=1 Tax=Streptomyces sp. NPDC047028 TaxID=3155793 RepID=UPI0033C59C23
MAILWVLMALLMVAFVLSPMLRDRVLRSPRTGVRRRALGAAVLRPYRFRGGPTPQQVPPGHPDAADPAAYGFMPEELLDVRMPGPDEDLLAVLDVVQRTQDYRPAARLLAGTDAEGELRWQRVQALAGAAALELTQRPGGVHETPGGQWLRVWRAEQPKEPGGAAVHAEFLAQHAWRTSDPDTEEFRVIMDEARQACAQAALLAPGDPVPHIVELSVARGLAVPKPEFDALWLRIIDVAPHHMGAHLAALHYWCEKWHGSRAEAYTFAETAAARAPQGSPLAALPLFAVFEHLPEVNLVRGFYQSEVVIRAMHGALHAVHAADQDDADGPVGADGPEDPTLAHVRHLLIFFLVAAERWAEAMSQLIHVDGHVGALPWTLSEDPAADFAFYRALAVAGYESNGGTPVPRPA